MADSVNSLIRLEQGLTKTIGATDNVQIGGNFQSANLTATGGLDVTGNALIQANLTVLGDTISGGQRDFIVEDNFIDLNNGQQGADQSGGFTCNIRAAQSVDINAAGTGATFVAAGAGGATVSINGFNPNVLAADDIIEFSGFTGAAAGNNGLFAVKSVVDASAGLITIYTAAEVAAAVNIPFCQTDFVAGTEDAGSLGYELKLAVAAFTDGTLTDAAGNPITPAGAFVTAYSTDANAKAPGNAGAMEYEASQNVTLQEAYQAGAGITLADAAGGGAGDMIIKTDDTNPNPADFKLNNASNQNYLTTGTQGTRLTVGAGSNVMTILDGQIASDITFATGAARSIGVTSAALTMSTTTTGKLTVSGAADMLIDSDDEMAIKMEASDNNDKSLLLSATNAGAGNGFIQMDADKLGATILGSGIAVTSTGKVSVSGSNGAADAMKLEAANVGNNAGMQLRSALDIDAQSSHGGISLDGVTASNLTIAAISGVDQDLTLRGTNGGAGDSKLDVDFTHVAIDSSVGAVAVTGAVDASVTATTGAASVVATAGAVTLTGKADSVWGLSGDCGAADKTLTIQSVNSNAGGANSMLLESDVDVVLRAASGAVIVQQGQYTNQTGSQITINTLVTVDASGDQRVKPADAASIAGASVFGAVVANANNTNPVLIRTCPGTPSAMIAGSGGTTRGEVVYLGKGADAGKVVMQGNLGTASGDAVHRVGIAMETQAAAAAVVVHFLPQFVATIP